MSINSFPGGSPADIDQLFDQLCSPATELLTKQELSELSLLQFFTMWYGPEMQRADRRRKPTSTKTLQRRGDAVKWWSRLMASPGLPQGPPLKSITSANLAEFRQRLSKATFQRGPKGQKRLLAFNTQIRHVEELMIVLEAAGQPHKHLVRAGVLKNVPWIWLDALTDWPKDSWSLAEARTIAQAIPHRPLDVRSRGRWPKALCYRDICRAVVAFWFYTGHRATTLLEMQPDNLVQSKPGQWWLHIRSVKTGKLDRLAVHPLLLSAIRKVRTGSQLIPWPWGYTTLVKHHKHWQQAAKLDELRTFSPQGWRRFHDDQMAAMGFERAQELATATLGHSDPSITSAGYCDVRSAALVRLPHLFGE